MATAPDRLRRAKPLLGTFVEIAAAHAAPDLMESAVEDAFNAIARVHRCMSFHDPASDVSRLNQHAAAGAVTVDPWTFQVLEAAVDDARSEVASLIGADPSEVLFTSGGTEGDNIAIRGAAEAAEPSGRRHLIASMIFPLVLDALRRLGCVGV